VNLRVLIIAFGMLLVSVANLAQTKITVSNNKPASGQTILLEVDLEAGANTSIVWVKQSGEGAFEGETKGQSKVRFRPSKPGQVVIVCEIQTPDGEFRPRATLEVSGQEPASSSVPVATSAQEKPSQEVKPPQPPKPTRTAQRTPLPPGSLSIDSIEFSVPSGWMGDALSENGQTAVLSGGRAGECHWGNGCYRVEYKLGKLGWAAFAWQVVPEGNANWGEHSGVNLSSSRFQSLRLWAKGQVENDAAPKVQFKSGGNIAPQFSATVQGTYAVATPQLQLSGDWNPVCLDLKNRNLSNVVSPFTVAVSRIYNPEIKTVVIQLDDVYFSPIACEGK